MHNPKSRRHQKAANARWREDAAQAQRDAGIPDRPPLTDARTAIEFDLRTYGGPWLRIEPRIGYIACRATDQETGAVECAALKTLLHGLADSLPRTMSAKSVTNA